MSGEGGPLAAGDGLTGTAGIVQAGLDQARQTLFSAADVPLAGTYDLLAAVSGYAVRIVLEMRIEQIVKHGHTSENDEMLPILWLPKQAKDYAQIACDRIGVTGKDRNLDAAERALARCAALCLASIDRLRQARGRDG